MNTTPIDYHKTLADILRTLLDQENISQAKLEKRASLAQKTVSNVLRQANSPSLANVVKLAEGFDLPPWALLLPYRDTSDVSDRALQKAVEALLNLPPDRREQAIAAIIESADVSHNQVPQKNQ